MGAWAKNLVDPTWVNDVISEFGEESPFVQARIHARFPRTTTNVTIPIDWLEAAVVEEPVWGGRVRLGVDVAADSNCRQNRHFSGLSHSYECGRS